MRREETREPRKVDRRRFLAAAAAGLAAGCGWDGGDALRPLQRRASRLNDRLGEALLSHDPAPKYDESERSRSFPNYHISAMTPVLDDPSAWRLRVGGLVRHPLELSLAAFLARQHVASYDPGLSADFHNYGGIRPAMHPR